MEPDYSTNSDRLEYLYLNLVGQLVQVHTIDGAISEGIFVSRTDPETPDDEAGIFITCPRFLRSELHKPLDPSEFTPETKVYYYKDLVMMEAVHVKIRTETPGAGNVYNYRGEHDLKALDWAEEGNEELLEEDRNTGEWDQFEANKRFGVHSTYDEDIYTTKLDKSKVTKEQIEYADRVAREIERSTARGVQHLAEREDVAPADIDEGALFSDVARKPKRGDFVAQSAAVPNRKGNENAKGAAAAATAAAASTIAIVNANVNANASSSGKRGAVQAAAAEEAATPPPLGAGVQSRDFNPNPAATPFVPSRPIIKDYLRSLAHAIDNNDACFQSDPDWPGEEDHYDKDDSSYTHQQQYQQPPPPQFAPQPQGQFVPQQQQQQQGMPPQGFNANAGNPNNFGRQGHQVMGTHPQHHFQQNMAPSYNPSMQQHMPQQHPSYMDPNQMGGGQGPSPPPPRMAGGMPPQQQQQQQPRASSSKGSQPQQPVVTALPNQQPQQQPQPQPQPQPPQQQPVVPLDSSVPEKPAPAKKLTRGMKAAQPRADAAGDNGPSGGKRGGK